MIRNIKTEDIGTIDLYQHDYDSESIDVAGQFATFDSVGQPDEIHEMDDFSQSVKSNKNYAYQINGNGTVDGSYQSLKNSNGTSSCANFPENWRLMKDEFTIFGDFVASELRVMRNADDLRSKLKRHIQQVIVDISGEYAERLYGTK